MRLQPGIFAVTEEDFPRVLEVWEASVRATHWFTSEEDIAFFRPLIRGALPQIKQIACVRDETGQLEGFVAGADGKVDMLFLHPEIRGQGAGKALLLYAVQTFGADRLDVNEQNEPAVAFYRHMGFEVVGRSEVDDFGKPHPLLHMQLSGRKKGNDLN